MSWDVIMPVALLIVGLVSMRFGSIIRSKPAWFRLAGIFAVAAAISRVVDANGGGDIWNVIYYHSTFGFYWLVSLGIWKAGSTARDFLRLERNGSG